MDSTNKLSVEDRILKSASEMFIRHGLKPITMDMVAASVGMSKRTLYEKFQNKDALLKACVERQLEFQTRSIQDGNHESVIHLMYDFYYYAKKYANLINRNYYREMRRYYPDVYALVEENQQLKWNQNIQRIKVGMEKGLIREEVNPEISVVLFKVQFDLLWMTDELVTEKFSVSDVIGEIIINFIRGISTPKGIALLEELIREKQ